MELTVCLDSDVHLGLRGVRDGVCAKLNIGAVSISLDYNLDIWVMAYFFMTMYLRAFPRV